MSDNDADVLLITRDPRLRELVSRHRPAAARLRCVLPDELHAEPPPPAAQFWVDLDNTSRPLRYPSDRRVYFYSATRRLPGRLPPGLFVRKPCTRAVLEVLWAGATLRDPHRLPTQTPETLSYLPAWLLEFQELSLAELCRRLVARLPARLGYADVSLYLYDPTPRVLSLAESNHTRPIDLAVCIDDCRDHLMAAVARTGQVLVTNDVEQACRAHGVRRPRHSDSYADGACIIAPLVSGGELQGVINLSRREPTGESSGDPNWPETFAFLGRSLEHARLYERTRTEARVDNLTGLFNRRWIAETLEKEIHRTRRFKHALSLIVLDLDGLKTINDQAGHLAGDAVLQHVAGKIVAALRQIDSAARMGGDEFVVVLPTTGVAGARQVGQRVLAAIRTDAAIFRGSPLPITASLGVAEWQDGWQAERLIEAADQMMYTAKHQGGNRLACRAIEAPLPAPTSQPPAAPTT